VLCSGLIWRAGRWEGLGEGGETYGPMSDGVTGSEGGGGRLIRVGVADILAILSACVWSLTGLGSGGVELCSATRLSWCSAERSDVRWKRRSGIEEIVKWDL